MFNLPPWIISLPYKYYAVHWPHSPSQVQLCSCHYTFQRSAEYFCSLKESNSLSLLWKTYTSLLLIFFSMWKHPILAYLIYCFQHLCFTSLLPYTYIILSSYFKTLPCFSFQFLSFFEHPLSFSMSSMNPSSATLNLKLSLVLVFVVILVCFNWHMFK